MMPAPKKYNWIELSEELLRIKEVAPEDGSLNISAHEENYPRIVKKSKELTNAELADLLTRYGDRIFNHVDTHKRPDGTIRVWTKEGSMYVDAGVYDIGVRRGYGAEVARLHTQGVTKLEVLDTGKNMYMRLFFFQTISRQNRSNVGGIMCL